MSQGDSLADTAELVLGLVSPVGTDLDNFVEKLAVALKGVGYSANVVRLSALALKFDTGVSVNGDEAESKASPEFVRLSRAMDAGNEARRSAKNVLALAAAAQIHGLNRPEFRRDSITRVLPPAGLARKIACHQAPAGAADSGEPVDSNPRAVVARLAGLATFRRGLSMRRFAMSALACFALGTVGCRSGKAVSCEGSLGCECYPNGTCNADLMCSSSGCEKRGGGFAPIEPVTARSLLFRQATRVSRSRSARRTTTARWGHGANVAPMYGWDTPLMTSTSNTSAPWCRQAGDNPET